MRFDLPEQLECVDWHNDWEYNFETATARRRDGWAFQFHPAEGIEGVIVGECTDQPLFFQPGLDFNMVAQEAGEMYFDALRHRH